MKKVVLVAMQWSRAGGLEIVIQDIAKSFRDLGWSVVVLASGGGRKTGTEESGIDVKYLEPASRLGKSLWHRYFKYPALAYRVQKELSRGGLLILGHVHLAPLISFLPKQKNVVSWIWTYGIDVWGKCGVRWAPCLDKLDTPIAISQYTRKHLVEAGITKEVKVVPCCVDVMRFIPTTTPDKIRRNEVLICGRLSAAERYKGHEILFDALPIVEKLLGQPVILRVVGGGDDEIRLKEEARARGLLDAGAKDKEGIKSRVIFSGRVSDAALLEAYQHCGVFAMPSRAEYRSETDDWAGEGFGLVYAEAEACGRPVVASCDGGAPETIIPGITGLLADPRSPQANAEAIARILADHEWADKLGLAGREHAVKTVSFERFKKSINELVADEKKFTEN